MRSFVQWWVYHLTFDFHVSEQLMIEIFISQCFQICPSDLHRSELQTKP